MGFEDEVEQSFGDLAVNVIAGWSGVRTHLIALLRTRSERPRDHTTAEKRDELAPL
jgi:hypothetical protein